MKQQLDLEVKNFFDLLASTSSIKAKKQLLAERRDDGNVKKYLDYLLNPFFWNARMTIPISATMPFGACRRSGKGILTPGTDRYFTYGCIIKHRRPI